MMIYPKVKELFIKAYANNFEHIHCKCILDSKESVEIPKKMEYQKKFISEIQPSSSCFNITCQQNIPSYLFETCFL